MPLLCLGKLLYRIRLTEFLWIPKTHAVVIGFKMGLTRKSQAIFLQHLLACEVMLARIDFLLSLKYLQFRRLGNSQGNFS